LVAFLKDDAIAQTLSKVGHVPLTDIQDISPFDAGRARSTGAVAKQIG